MRPVEAIKPEPWMTAPETTALLAALGAGGSVARFVGGCVRDAILGRPVKDIDVATPDPPERVIELLDAAGLKSVPTGLKHGTVTALVGDHPFEVTTLRRDVRTDGRHAVVAFTDQWEVDAQRRDFTFNALYADADGTIYDPTGGLADLKAGKVRFVGDPAARIAEDHLRILRFFRFVAYFGRTAPDSATLAACADGVSALRNLSAERVAAEVLRLLRAPDPTPALALMGSVGVLQEILPEATRLEVLPRLREIELSSGFEPDPLLRLAALIAPAGAAGLAGRIATRFKFSNADRKQLKGYLEPKVAVEPAMASNALHVALYRVGYRTFTDLVFLAWARAGQDHDAYIALLTAVANWDIPKFPLDGRDAKRAGIAEGPAVGRLLTAVERWWIENDFSPDRRACLRQLRRLGRAAPG
jgi:poly(A) polymerase